MAPVLDLVVEVFPADSPAELLDGLAPADVVDDVDESEAVAEGVVDRDVGESVLRQVASSEIATFKTSELPPCRPFESVIIHMMDVPAATSASQSNEVGPEGTSRMNVCPPGMTPYN